MKYKFVAENLVVIEFPPSKRTLFFGGFPYYMDLPYMYFAIPYYENRAFCGYFAANFIDVFYSDTELTLDSTDPIHIKLFSNTDRNGNTCLGHTMFFGNSPKNAVECAVKNFFETSYSFRPPKENTHYYHWQRYKKMLTPKKFVDFNEELFNSIDPLV
jgi:hypothetical protein